MSKRKATKAVTTAAPTGAIANAAALLAALASITADAARTLGTVAYGGMYRTVSAGHVNKRGLFVASIIATVAGDGTFDTLKAWMRTFAVPAMRAELAYAVASGDVAYFRARTGGWCQWALPLTKDGALDPNATDDALFTAFERTCPTNPANVNGMLTEVTLAAQRRNVTPLPVFADAVVSNRVTAYDPDAHGEHYAARGYGHATFTLAAK